MQSIFTSPDPGELMSPLSVRRLSSVVRSSIIFSHFNQLLWCHWANLNQTLVEWSLDGPRPQLCPVIPTSKQDGRQMTKQVFRVFLKHVFYQSRYHSYNLWSIMILQSTPFILYKELLSMMITIIFMPWVHPFTRVIGGPTGSGKSVFVRRFVHHIRHMMTTIPHRILWCYGEYQTLYGTVDGVDFHQGLPDLDTLDPRKKHLIILDDLMDETDQRVASLFTKKSHHRNISVMYIVQNLFHREENTIEP